MERKEIKRQILITGAEGKYIQRAFRVSATTVWHAVTYKRSNDIHRKIRKFAVDRGNHQVVTVPDFDTLFMMDGEGVNSEHPHRYMMQWFENGAVLEGDMTTGTITLRDKHGQVRKTYAHVKVSEIEAIQEEAKTL